MGPRPHAIAHDNQFGILIAEYAFCQHVKPGITGLAEVKGCRGGTSSLEDLKRRIDYDLWYVNNWSFLLDLQILARTLVATILARNAYWEPTGIPMDCEYLHAVL